MKNNTEKEPQKIEEIIHSFENYALSDIDHNKEKPIAAFILCCCLINQLTEFSTNQSIAKKERPEFFINKYLPNYANKNFYNIVRHPIVHCYSTEKKYKIVHTNENYCLKIENNILYVNVLELIINLNEGFQKLKRDLLTIGSEENKNAIEYSKIHPIILFKS